MGRGDRKTRRGKIWRGTNGKSRPKKRKLRGKAAPRVRRVPAPAT